MEGRRKAFVYLFILVCFVCVGNLSLFLSCKLVPCICFFILPRMLLDNSIWTHLLWSLSADFTQCVIFQGPPLWLAVELLQFQWQFLWGSNSALSTCTTPFLSFSPLVDILLVLCLGYCKECCSEGWGACANLNLVFLRISAQGGNVRSQGQLSEGAVSTPCQSFLPFLFIIYLFLARCVYQSLPNFFRVVWYNLSTDPLSDMWFEYSFFQFVVHFFIF